MKKAVFPVKYYAHRGLHDDKIPENSTGAFLAAKEKGFGAELDILLDGDGNVVVFHDSNLKRMTGLDGLVWETPRAQIEVLRLGNTTEKVPYLDELLKEVSPMPLLVELKTCPRWKTLCEKTLPLLRKYGGHVAMESFDPRIVRWFKNHAPDITRGLLLVQYNDRNMPNAMKRRMMNSGYPIWLTKPHYLSIPEGCIDLPYVQKALKSGTALCTWTIRSKDHREADVITFEGFLPEVAEADATVTEATE